MREIESAIITGPTGALGQALCRCLLSRGIRVYPVCRSDSPRTKMLPHHPGLQIIPCEIGRLGMLPEILTDRKIDAFFHLAWAGNDGNNRNNMDFQAANIRYALDASRAAKELKCQVFVGAGSQAEYGRTDRALAPDTPCFPENGYGMAKLCAGQMTRVECIRLGIDHIWPRFLSIYGPYEQLSSMTISTILKLLRGEIPAMTAGEQMWDYLYADDAAEALYRMAAYGKNGAVYTVGTGKTRRLREYVEILRDTVDPSLSVDFGAIPYSVNQVMHLEADISLLTSDTGFIPKTDFREGIQKTVDWVRGTIQ